MGWTQRRGFMQQQPPYQPPLEVDDIMSQVGIPQDPVLPNPESSLESQPSESEPRQPQEAAPSALKGSLLQLPQERLNWLVERACDRIEECRNDMGVQFGNPLAVAGSWMWDRQVARLQYAGNFDWRKATGGVFSENNWSLNVCKRFIRLMAAKISGDLLGTHPYFAVMPESNETPELAKQVEAKVQSEERISNLKEALTEAALVALTEGERAVKLTWIKDETSYIGPAEVAVDAQGKPIKTPKGQYIFRKDDFVPDPTIGLMRLKKELSFVFPEGTQFPLKYMKFPRLKQAIVHRNGLDVSGVTSEDFIWPIKVDRLENADIMAHCYDESLEYLQAEYAYFPEVKNLSPTGTMAKQGQPNKEMGERESESAVIEKVNVHETCIRCDADKDGKEEWIFLILDYARRSAIYAEYLGNMHMKRPPYRLIRGVERVPGRAYGMGVYKMFEQKNLFIDVQFNRVALKSSKEGSITCVHRDFSEETKAGLEFKVGTKTVYHIPANSPYSKERPGVYRINLNEVDDFGMKLLETVIQTGQLEFGIVSAADGEASDLNASGTATGIRNIERTGNTLQRATEELIAVDIEEILKLATDLILENMDEEEIQFMPNSDTLATLNRNEIRNLDRDVRLLLTKARSEESLATNSQVVALIEKYYGYPKWEQKKVRPFFIEQLKTLEVQDADQRLDEPTDEEIQAEVRARAEGEKKPLSESIQAKFGDLPPELQQAFATEAFGKEFPLKVFQNHTATLAALKQQPHEPLRIGNNEQPEGQPGYGPSGLGATAGTEAGSGGQ